MNCCYLGLEFFVCLLAIKMFNWKMRLCNCAVCYYLCVVELQVLCNFTVCTLYNIDCSNQNFKIIECSTILTAVLQGMNTKADFIDGMFFSTA